MKIIKTFAIQESTAIILKRLKFVSGHTQSSLVDEAVKLLAKTPGMKRKVAENDL